jgi:uncharacterized protein (TIGR03067 family)
MYLLLLASFGLVFAADDKEEAVKKELAKLKGTWIVVSAEREGEAIDRLNDDKLIIEDGKITVKGKDNDHGVTFKLDPTTKPKTIDATPTDGPEKDLVAEGIYELDGDQLKLCFCRPGLNSRPTEFATKAGSNHILIVSKREKK